MLILSSNIVTSRSAFDAIVSVEINSSWENLVDTATFVIPKNIYRSLNERGVAADSSARFAPADKNNAILRRGDSVEITLGYSNDPEGPTERFTGFVSRVGSKIPVEVHCEDAMWGLKQTPLKQAISETSTTLSNLLTKALPDGFKFTCADISMGKIDTKGKVTVSEFLDYLKRHFGFSVYFRDGVLNVGLAYQTKQISDFVVNELPVFDFQRNIIEDHLEFVQKDDITYQVNVTNIKPDNSRKTFQFGDPGGEIRSFVFYDMPDGSIQSLANDMLNRYKYTGFRGSFTGFLSPRVRHGEAVRINDDIIRERSGVYLVKQVVTRSGISGGRQTITLDQKLS